MAPAPEQLTPSSGCSGQTVARMRRRVQVGAAARADRHSAGVHHRHGGLLGRASLGEAIRASRPHCPPNGGQVRRTIQVQLSGIGNTTASALVSTIGNAHDFKNGRQLAAWLGLVPGQDSSGGKTPARRHHQGRRWLPTDAARARCQGRTRRREDQRRPAQPLGDRGLRSAVATGRQSSPSPPRTPAWPGY